MEGLAGLAGQHINEQQRLVLAASGSAERRRAIDVAAEIAAFQDVVRPLLDGQGVHDRGGVRRRRRCCGPRCGRRTSSACFRS